MRNATRKQIMKNRKPIIEKITKRYENAHKVDCKNCNRDEKTCVMQSYMTKNSKCVWFEKKENNYD